VSLRRSHARDVAHIRSYRYFNNINRLAAKFPVAHTANTKDEVDVWCSNDYLGMSKNPIVTDTMK
jgi:5-aminolevulinate synthase